jgi:cell volume regulation protein A
VLVVTPRRLREKTEERLRQVSASGRLGHWIERPDRR